MQLPSLGLGAVLTNASSSRPHLLTQGNGRCIDRHMSSHLSYPSSRPHSPGCACVCVCAHLWVWLLPNAGSASAAAVDHRRHGVSPIQPSQCPSPRTCAMCWPQTCTTPISVAWGGTKRLRSTAQHSFHPLLKAASDARRSPVIRRPGAVETAAFSLSSGHDVFSGNKCKGGNQRKTGHKPARGDCSSSFFSSFSCPSGRRHTPNGSPSTRDCPQKVNKQQKLFLDLCMLCNAELHAQALLVSPQSMISVPFRYVHLRMPRHPSLPGYGTCLPQAQTCSRAVHRCHRKSTSPQVRHHSLAKVLREPPVASMSRSKLVAKSRSEVASREP